MTGTEIESAIEELPPKKVSELFKGLEEFEARIWGKQIERDLQNGSLQQLIFETSVAAF